MQPSRRHVLTGVLTAGVTFGGGQLAGCLERDTGRTEPNSPTDHSPTGTPTGAARRTRQQAGESPLAVVGETSVYVAVDGVLRALDLADGSEIWATSPGQLSALVVDGGTPYSLASDGTVRKHGGDGQAIWSATLDATAVSLISAGDSVVGLAEDGTLASYATRDATERWTQSIDGIPAGLAFDGRHVYVTNDTDSQETDAWLTAFSVADGTQQWRFHPGYRLIAAPEIVSGHVLVGTTNPAHEADGPSPTPKASDSAVGGFVVAYDADGSEVWISKKIEGHIAWLVGAEASVVVGYRGFLFSELDEVPQVAGLETDGTKKWHREKVAASKPTVITHGVALHTHKTGDRMIALRIGSGETVWTQQRSAGTAAAADEVFITVEPSAIRARGALGGRERWSTSVNK